MNRPLNLKAAFIWAANRVAADFPEKAGMLYVLSPEEDFYISPAAADILKNSPCQVMPDIKMMKERMVREKNLGGMAKRIEVYALTPYFNVIMLPSGACDTKGGRRAYTPGEDAGDIDALSVLWHELGHLVVKGGMRLGHASECAADAYAIINHLREFGAETGIFNHFPFKAASVLAHGTSASHYTSDVARLVDAEIKQTDISALSHIEIVTLAGSIAEKAREDDKKLRSLMETFRPLQIWLADNSLVDAGANDITPVKTPGYYKMLLTIMKNNPGDGDIAQVCADLISPWVDAGLLAARNGDKLWRDILSRTGIKGVRAEPSISPR